MESGSKQRTEQLSASVGQGERCGHERQGAGRRELPPYPCRTCGEVHPVCACGRARVICPTDEPGEPFAHCEWCETEALEPETSACAYHGWSNAETWRVALWLSSQPSTAALVAACLTETGADTAVVELARRLKDWIERRACLTGYPALYADLLGAALAAVDYDEIAEHLRRVRPDAT